MYEECIGCKIREPRIEANHRDISSHMITSHLVILLPCLWWLFGYNKGDYVSHCIDKIMAAVLTSAIIISSIYHYYYECVLCNFEYRSMIVNIILLNLYMIYRGVKYIFIILGFIILYLLNLSINAIHITQDDDIYEYYHPFCHYIAGIYVLYCVYFIERSFKN